MKYYNLNIPLNFSSTSFKYSSSSVPILPNIKLLLKVANFVNLITESTFKPFSWLFKTFMSNSPKSLKTEDIKQTITSNSPSYKTKAGLNFRPLKSVKGKGTKTISPFLNLIFNSLLHHQDHKCPAHSQETPSNSPDSKSQSPLPPSNHQNIKTSHNHIPPSTYHQKANSNTSLSHLSKSPSDPFIKPKFNFNPHIKIKKFTNKLQKQTLALLLFISLTNAQIIQIHQLNVAQGDACFIKIDTFKILIDGGPANKGNNIIIPYLSTLSINKLNFTIATHYHADHIGGLDEVILNLNPDICYDRGESYNTTQFYEYINAVGPRRQTLAVAETLINLTTPNGKITLSTLAVSGFIKNYSYAGTSDENTLSIALLLEFISNENDTFKFFTAGDLYAKQESILVVKNPELENTQLLKISHHGSKTSTPEILLQKLKPQAVIISTGENNPYNHPHPETLNKLQNAQSIRFIYQTTQGKNTTAKSVIAGHIIASVFDKFFTISTSNYPTRIDTFYFAKDQPLNTEPEPFAENKEKNKEKREGKMTLKTKSENGFTTLEISTPNETILKIAIFNILGQLIQEIAPMAEKTTLSIPNTASGLYLVRVQTNKNIYHSKFLITK